MGGQCHRGHLLGTFVFGLSLVLADRKVHLITHRKRFFSVFDSKESEVGSINRQEVVYIIVILFICLGISLLRISLRQIIELNGAVLGFFFIYFIPVAIHFKCTYMKKDRALNEENKES